MGTGYMYVSHTRGRPYVHMWLKAGRRSIGVPMKRQELPASASFDCIEVTRHHDIPRFADFDATNYLILQTDRQHKATRQLNGIAIEAQDVCRWFDPVAATDVYYGIGYTE